MSASPKVPWRPGSPASGLAGWKPRQPCSAACARDHPLGWNKEGDWIAPGVALAYVKPCDRGFRKITDHRPEAGGLDSDHGGWHCCETADVAFGGRGWGGIGSDPARGGEFRLQQLHKQIRSGSVCRGGGGGR